MSPLPEAAPVRFALRHWDAVASAMFALGFLISATLRSEPLATVQPFVIAAFAAGFTLGTSSVVAGRWVSDRIKDSDYGQLIRSIDSTESNFGRPYLIVAISGYVTSCYSIIVAVVEGMAVGSLRVLLLAILLLFVMYTVFGSISLLFLSQKHISRVSALRALREESERDRRMKREN